jgi:hypothetical protein
VLAAAGSDVACAHGIGQRYDLPLPLWLYLVGAGSAVAASFVFITFVRADRLASRFLLPSEHTSHGSANRARDGVAHVSAENRACLPHPPSLPQRGMALPRWCIALARAVSLIAFVLTIATGLLGNQSPVRNFAPVFVWVIWWVGFAFLCAFVANLWLIVNPADVLFDCARVFSPSFRRRSASARFAFPARLGAWPAVAGFLAFAWVELVAPERDAPRLIAIGVLAYVGATLWGYLLFGARVWQRCADPFAIFFGLLGRFAPACIVRSGKGWTCRLRFFAVGLLSRRRLPVSLTAFALLMLATVTTDGFMETPAWAAVMEYLTPAAATPLSTSLPPLWPPTLLLLAMPALFTASYLLTVGLMARLAPQSPSISYLAGRFVLTLIPIAIAYHVAHYFSFLLLAGQLVIPLLSDPFGLGWDLFGTALYRMDIGIVSARTVWLVAVAAIVLGHILATWLAHVTAVSVFVEPRAVRAASSRCSR